METNVIALILIVSLIVISAIAYNNLMRHLK